MKRNKKRGRIKEKRGHTDSTLPNKCYETLIRTYQALREIKEVIQKQDFCLGKTSGEG